MENLIRNERIISSSDDNTISLSNYRITYHTKGSGNANLNSIMLDKISSVEMKYESSPWLLIVAIVSGVLAGYAFAVNHDDGPLFIGGLISVICVILYFASRRHLVTITPDGGSKIKFYSKGMSSEAHMKFINNIHEARLSFLQAETLV